jgi:hypothetical protein
MMSGALMEEVRRPSFRKRKHACPGVPIFLVRMGAGSSLVVAAIRFASPLASSSSLTHHTRRAHGFPWGGRGGGGCNNAAWQRRGPPSHHAQPASRAARKTTQAINRSSGSCFFARRSFKQRSWLLALALLGQQAAGAGGRPAIKGKNPSFLLERNLPFFSF